jgi:hypothetical protein
MGLLSRLSNEVVLRNSGDVEILLLSMVGFICSRGVASEYVGPAADVSMVMVGALCRRGPMSGEWSWLSVMMVVAWESACARDGG